MLLLPIDAHHSVGLGVADAAHVRGAPQGATVSYTQVRPGSDLRFAAGAGHATEQIILYSASAPESWIFPLTLTGLRARMGRRGEVEFTDAAGRVRAVLPPGLMTDSNINRSGSGTYSGGVRYSLTTLAGQPAIRMMLDASWLDARGRVFPVTVTAGPSVSSFNSTGTTYVMSGSPNTDFSSDTEIKAGTYDGGSDIAKSFMKFNVSSLNNDTVLGVRLSLFNSWSFSCNARTLDVYPVTHSWSVTGNKTYPGPSTGGAVGRKSFATGWVPAGSSVSPCPASWQAIDLGQAGTNLVNGWTHGAANNGLALGASSSDSYGWKKFTSDNNQTGDPFLAVTYTADGADYELASKQPVTQVTPTQNGKIAIAVTNESATTWTPSNGYELSYRAYDAKGNLVADAPVFTPMPATVAPGQMAIVNATVNHLPAGAYAVNFSMYSGVGSQGGPVSFASQGIPPFAMGLYVAQPPPVVNGVYPPTGYLSPTTTPQLSTTANSASTYQFTMICEPLPGTTCPGGTISSGQISNPYWTPPSLIWNEPYQWTVTVTNSGGTTTVGPVSLIPEVPQPAVTSRLGSGSSGQPFDPQTGDYVTSATDAAVAVPGPPLEILRSYNSLDPRTSGTFGAGWSSPLDMQVAPDTSSSTTSSVVVDMPDGSQARFGYGSTNTNGSISYVPPFGSSDVLQQNTGGSWRLMVAGGTTYNFNANGSLTKITTPGGLSQAFTANSAGQITTITDTSSGRALHLTWSTPTGAANAHVATVTTDPAQSGQAGLQWSYSYAGDELTQVCNADSQCTSYSYGTSLSHFPTSVLDAGPRSYYPLNDPAGASAAADTVPVNLGTTNGTYTNVTLGGAGPVQGSTGASFNGTSSYVTLASNLITDSTYLSVGVWFKTPAAGGSGVLFGYQSNAITSGVSGHWVPALYVGNDGYLYGEFWNGSVDPMSSGNLATMTGQKVNDGQWHYAVLTGAGTTQTLYLDGVAVASMSGTIDQQDNTNDYVGAGLWSGRWPSNSANPVGYFSGSIADAAVYQQALPPATISQQYSLSTTTSPELTQVSLPSGRTYEQMSYDTVNDRLSSYTDPNGGTWTLHLPVTTGYKATSDALGEAITAETIGDPAGRDEVYYYDAINGGRLAAYNRGAGAGPRTFGYDQAGCLDAVTDEDSKTITFTNDAFCNVLARSWNDVTGCPPSGTCTTYYSYFSSATNRLDPRNNLVTAIRDGRSSSAADNTYQTSYVYNSTGQLTSATTPATSDFPSGRVTANQYSTGTESGYSGGTIPAGLLLSTTTPGNAVTGYAYYANGDLAQVTEPSGRRTVYTYDNLGRPLTATVYTSTYPGGLPTSYTYSNEGQPLTVTYPGISNIVTSVTHTPQDTYTYDTDGNLTSLTQSDLTGGDKPRTTRYTYDDHGNLATVTDPPGNASGAIPADFTTSYNWDSSGNLASKIDADGNEYDYTYNEYNQVTQVTLTSDSTSQANPGGGTSVVLSSYSYDPAGLLAATTDALGRITNYAYDAGERLIAVTKTDSSTNPSIGRQTAYGYDNAGNLTSLTMYGMSGGLVQTSQQSLTSYAVDAADRLTQQTVDPTGVDQVTSYTYNPDDEPTQVTVSKGSGSSTTSYGYDAAGDRTSQTVLDGAVHQLTTWTYDQNGLPLTMTDPRGNVNGGTPANFTTSYSYDQSGQLSSLTGPPVQVQTFTARAPVTTQPVTTYGHDTYGELTQQGDPDNNLTTATYDGDGNLASVTQPGYTPPGSTVPVTATTSNTYDGLGNLVSTTDPAGNTTSYTYDALGDMTSRTDPQLPGQSSPGVWTWTYDSAGELQTATDPTHAQTQDTWDYFGDLATSTQDISDSSQPTGTTSYHYNYLGKPNKVTTGAGVITTSAYDAAGELKSTTDAYSDTTSYTYNQLGEIASLTRPDQTSVGYGYDPAGNLTSTTEYGPASSAAQLDSQSFGYNLAGDLSSATDGRNNTTSFTYNAANQVTGESQPVSATSSINTSFGYDAAGNQTAYTDGRGNTTWTTYNTWNLPESVIEPSTTATPGAAQRTYTTGYDADSRPVTLTEPGGVSLAAQYDPLGDLTKVTGTGAEATTPTQSLGYDLDGRLTSATAPGGTDGFTWNDAGNVTTTSGPSGSASFTYFADGQMHTRSDAAGTTSYTYDNAGRLATIADPATGATLAYGYTPNSQPSTISYSTGGTQGPTQTFGYTGLEQLASDGLTTSGGATIASAGYLYDADGNLSSQTTTGFAGAGTTTYGYDDANRLTSATTGGVTTSYSNDASGNLTQAGTTSYNYDARDQLTSSTSPAGTTNYSWTPRGTLATITPPSGSAQNYAYNALGQLATAPGGTSYAYDGLGRLATSTTTSGAQAFSYSGLGLTLASDGSQNYTYTPDGAPVGMVTASGLGRSVLTDLHDDITGLFKPAAATSNLLGSAAYGPYGGVTASTGAGSDLGYQDQWTDPGTGFASMGARWYDPATGAFTSHDTTSNSPVPGPGNANLYSYANASPLTNTDPTGQCIFCWSAIHTALVAGPSLATRFMRGVGAFLGAIPEGLGAGLSWGLAGGAAIWGLSSWFNPQPVDDPSCPPGVCTAYSGEGYGFWGGGSQWSWFPDGYPGTGGGGGGSPCGFSCFPPPPPPPPQDIFAGPNGAAAPSAPSWMRTAPYLTNPIHYTTNPADLFHHGPHVIEQPTADPAGPIGGLTEFPIATKPNPFLNDNNLNQTQLRDTGKPTLPTTNPPAQSSPGPAPHPVRVALPVPPAPATQAGSAGSGSGGGSGKRPVQLHLPFPEPEPGPEGGQVPYGRTDLSRFIIELRQDEGVTSGHNAAVFVYDSEQGLQAEAGFSDAAGPHAERLIWQQLQADGVRPEDVREIYSELQPCTIPGGYCADWIERMFPQARVTWSFQYGDTAASRAQGVAELARELARIFGR